MFAHTYELNLMWTEVTVVLLVTAFCLVLCRRTSLLDRLTRNFGDFARQSRRAVLCVFLFTLLLRVAVWPVRPVQVPLIHDEFSYLLLGDTFAHGRVVNPTHPMWMNFETFHVIQHPVYASVYPIAQGFFLATGQILANAPWLGVWISVALMCAALCWMLQGWLPPAWAFAGGLLAAIRIGTFSYWTNSYWGGAAAALGGSLVLGAIPRILRRPKPIHGFVFATGVAVLANSRPYEGFALCLAILPIAAAWLFRWNRLLRALGLPSRKATNSSVVKVLIPALLVLILAASFMGYYFWRVSGSPLKLPFSLEREQYGIAQTFVWQANRAVPPHYNHKVMELFYRGWEPIASTASAKFATYWMFFLGPALSIPLLALHRIVLDRRTRFLLITVAVGVAAVSVVRWANPHYFAPFVAAIYGLILQGIRHLNAWTSRYRRTRPIRAAFIWVIPCVIVTMVAVPLVAPALGLTISDFPMTWASPTPSRTARTDIIQSLRKIGGRHLIIVRYLPGHVLHEEFVYNDADIDASTVVWARSIDDAKDQELIRYFAGRHIWLMEAGERVSVVPYPTQTTTNASAAR